MKKIIKNIRIISLLSVATIITSCTDLDVDFESELSPDNFPKTESQFDAATGSIYSRLSGGSYMTDYWLMQELSTDEAILPAYDGNWDDGGNHRDMHKQKWTPENSYVSGTWNLFLGGINAVNSTIEMLSSIPDSPVKAEKIAQIRFMRALFYFYLMDSYGNVPILEKFGDKGKTNTRAEVFVFIEKELKEITNMLPTERILKNYARPTQWSAYALLAKIYINSEVYYGTGKYNECVAACDEIIKSGLYGLDEDYISIFKSDNGPNQRGLQIKETIFAVWFDAIKAIGQQFTRYAMNPYLDLEGKYGLKPGTYNISNALSTLYSFYQIYDEPEKDKRMIQWIRGKQYDAKGNPIIKTFKKGTFDYRLTNTPEAQEDTVWHVELSDEHRLKVNTNPEAMDIGKDILGQCTGIRNIKFWPDPNMSYRYASNNFPVFRYADILMMKAEAIVRGNLSGDAVGLVNQIRNRAGTTPLTTITLDEIYKERGREFAYEMWRRNDMIRFNDFHRAWTFKEKSEPFRSIFPIPFEQLRVNSDLIQNPGYPSTK